MEHTTEHIVDVFRQLVYQSNFLKSFLFVVKDEQLSASQNSEIRYPALIVELPEIDLEHSKCEAKKGISKKYLFNWYVVTNTQKDLYRDIYAALATNDRFTDILMYSILQTQSNKKQPLPNVPMLFNDLEFTFLKKVPFVPFAEDNITGWQTATTVDAKYCNPHCWEDNFTVCATNEFLTSNFAIKSTDGNNVTLEDLSNGTDPSKNIWITQDGNNKPDFHGETIPTFTLTTNTMLVWLKTTDPTGKCERWSRFQINGCCEGSFCFTSYPSGRCKDIIVK